TITDQIDAARIAQAGDNLKLIANFGNGVDKIDVSAAAKKGITVTNTPNVLTEDTADMTMALMLAVLPFWTSYVARRAKAFGLSIHYHNRHRVLAAVEDELEATYWESLDQMLARMDIISVNCPSTPATFHLLSARRLALLQPSAYIVNTARGDIIDEDSLVKLIQDGKIAGAGLDVYEHEPALNSKLLKLAAKGKVVLLPHMGSATLEGRIDMGEKVIINIRAFFDGHRPPDRVLPLRT
ncbi:MAG: D-glycerate dehydrogenase, partial [Mesorhizobium sp.]